MATLIPLGMLGVPTLLWLTATPLGTGSTSAVIPTAQNGRTIKIGDLIMSTNANSLNVFGQVTDVASQLSVTVAYVGSMRGATGDKGDTGATGATGLSIWATATQIGTSGTTTAVVPLAITGRTPQVGDLVLSSNASSMGVLGSIASVQSATSVTVTYLATTISPINRTVQANDNATGSVTDTGGALTIPLPVTVTTGSPSTTPQATGTFPLRTVLQTLINNLLSKQNSLSRTVVGDSTAIDAVTDTGGNLAVPIPVTLTTPTGSLVQLSSGSIPVQTAIQTVANNVNELFSITNNIPPSSWLLEDATRPTLSSVASDWTIVVMTCIRFLRRCTLYLSITPTTAPGTGNITDITLCTIQDGFRPLTAAHGRMPNVNAGLSLGTSGVLSLTDVQNAWSANEAYTAVLDYLLMS